MTTVTNRTYEFSPGSLVTLFQLDLNPLGVATILYFTSDNMGDGTEIVFEGKTYTQVDVAANGFEFSGTGPIPTPSLSVSNVGGFLGSLLQDYGDLVGAGVTRIRTFSSFLDGEADRAGLVAYEEYAFPKDIYTVEQKTSHTKLLVEWKLSSALDQQGRMLPARQVLRDNCLHTYRYWNGSAFDYSRATCPYKGGSFNVSSVSRSANVSTVVTSAAHDIKIGEKFKVSGVTPTSFNGTWTVASVPNTTSLTFSQTDVDVASTLSSGTVERYYTRLNASTGNAAEDQCGKQLSSCKLRFGDNGPLPTRAFPGVGRNRVN